jgi:hypothetical protein
MIIPSGYHMMVYSDFAKDMSVLLALSDDHRKWIVLYKSSFIVVEIVNVGNFHDSIRNEIVTDENGGIKPLFTDKALTLGQ